MRSQLALFLPACAALALSAPSRAQVTESLIDLDPTLPNNTAGTPNRPSPVPLESYRLTVGDLNADGIPDLVFSNAVAFVRVYFMQPSGNSLSVAGWDDVLPYGLVAADCASTGTGARMLSVAPWGIDTPVIYDIDLDGVNELIYLEHVPSGSNKGQVQLRVYRLSTTSPFDMVPDTHATLPASSSLLGLLLTGRYFSASCTNPTKNNNGGESLYMRIVNVRGRAFPQDILVWTHGGPNNKNCMVFGYDTNPGGTPTLVKLFEHFTKDSLPNEWEGAAGHTWSSLDIDYDGREEIIGRHVVTWDPVTQTKQVRWGVSLKADPTLPGESDDCHPDHISGLDFIASYLDPLGRQVPAPGIEMIAAPQNGGSVNKPDPSGALIYRAITGHQFGTQQSPAAWPRKVINIDDTGDGAEHWFPSNNPLGWKQPDPDSRWSDFGNALYGSTIESKNPNCQVVVPLDLVNAVDPSTLQEISPGRELFVLSKGSLKNMGNACGPGQLHFLFDDSVKLKALGWEQSTATSAVSPTIHGTFPMDFFGTRDAIEVHSLTGVGCTGGTVRHQAFRWVLHPGYGPTQPRSVTSVSDWTRATSAGERIGFQDGTTARDLFGDSREEIAISRNSAFHGPTQSYTESHLLVARDTQSVSRPQPTPWRYLDYRRRADGHSPQAVDFESFDGMRFRTTHLPRGKANQSYGFQQDKSLVQSLLPLRDGAGIAVEGGVGTCTLSIESGVLPAGISAVQLPPADVPDGAVLFFKGTPTQMTTQRIEVRATDSASPPNSIVKSFWIAIDAGTGTPLPDPRPRISSGGFEGAYLSAGIDAAVTVTAFVDDANGDVSGVDLFDAQGAFVASLGQVTATKWQTSFGVGAMGPGSATHYTMVAQDLAGNRSLRWPYLTVDGGPGHENPTYPVTPPNGQPASSTPTIAKVTTDVPTIAAGEISDAGGSLDVTVYVADRKNMTVDLVEVRMVHPLTGGDLDRYRVQDVPLDGTVMRYSVTLTPDASQIGWGEYALQARVRVTNGVTSFVSDWWPQLVAH